MKTFFSAIISPCGRYARLSLFRDEDETVMLRGHRSTTEEGLTFAFPLEERDASCFCAELEYLFPAISDSSTEPRRATPDSGEGC